MISIDDEFTVPQAVELSGSHATPTEGRNLEHRFQFGIRGFINEPIRQS